MSSFLVRFLLLASVASSATAFSPESPVDVDVEVDTAAVENTCAEDTTTSTTTTKENTNANANSTTTTTTSTDSSSTKNHQEALVNWLIKEKGGYFNDKVQFKALFEGGPNGMFATDNIAKNETLLIIPFQALFTSDIQGDGPSFDICDTTRHLVQEYHKKETSQFAPYVNYIFDQKQYNKLPAAWSEPARILLQEIIGDELEPQGVDEMDFWDSCATPKEYHLVPEEQSQLYTDAYRAVISRSWNDVMIPVYDMVNHRNGRYHNMDQLTTAHSNTDVVVVALRDIQKGEQLYISYNECLDTDCEGVEYTYILPQILKDYGFVEQYPRRWAFSDDPDEDEASILFELYQDEETQEITLEWITEEPNRNGLAYLRGHLARQQKLHDEWIQRANQLTAPYERDTIIEYHEAIMTALEMAILQTGVQDSALEEPEQTCTPAEDDNAEQQCTVNIEGRYSDLENQLQGEERVQFASEYSLCSAVKTRYLGDTEYEILHDTESFHQTIAFEHNDEIDDTCLFLSGWLQTCTSWRPHYHESIVHTSASFLENVTRVAILGGGDNMMIHEVLKYNDQLEVVLDMELDQEVVRQSFRNMGTQPHFDNPKVQWWFGDATKSLSLLPQEYFGTFDLVLVDLLTNLVETLQVTPTKTIMDVAMDLLKPEGIVARNEDFYPRRKVGFARYEIDLELLDVPFLCQQSITIGSKTVDFMAKTPTDHGIDSLYYKYNNQKFDNWFNYRNNKDKVFDEGPVEINSPNGAHGVHLIFEVEHATLKKNGAEETRKSISKALSGLGFTEMSVAVSKADEESTAMFLFREGYLLAQFWPERGYVGFDLKQWTQVDKQEAAKNKIAEAVQGSVTTSYRIVTGGMSGQEEAMKPKTEPEQVSESDESASARTVEQEKTVDNAEDATAATAVEALALVPSPAAVVAVVCPEKATGCKTMDTLYKQNLHITRKIIPVYTCAGLTDATMYACERDIESGLLDDLKAMGGASRIGGIIFDSEAPIAMGQIVHLLFSDKLIRNHVLDNAYAVIYTSDEPTTSWQRGLLERFQTEFDPFSPAERAQVSLSNASGSFELGVFSSGNHYFYADFAKMLKDLESKSGLSWEVNHVEDGVIGYEAEFHPSVIPANTDFDKTDALRQWSSQLFVGHHTVFQFGIQAPWASLEVDEIVLVEYESHIWKGEWVPGRVLKKEEGGKYIVELETESEMEVERSSLRRLDFNSDIQEMDLILIRNGNVWTQGAIIEKVPNERSYKVRKFDDDGIVLDVKRMDMVPRVESSDKSKEPSPLMTVNLSEAVATALQEASIDLDAEEDVQAFWGFGSGCVVAAFWSSGCAVMTWDGKDHVDISFLTDDENGSIRRDFVVALTKEIPALVLSTRDDQPRGAGRIVNFQIDMEDSPTWVEAFE